MAKYHKMAQDPYFIDLVSYVNGLQKELVEAYKRANNLGDNDSEYASSLNDAQDIGEELTRAELELYDVVKREYELVPLTTSRNQGIAGFYREVGLRRPA